MERERKRSAPPRTIIEKDVVVEKFRWKNGGGSARLTIGGIRRIIKPGEVFYANENEIPQAFKNTILPLEPIVKKEPPAPAKKVVTPKFRVVPSIESKEDEELFDVINSKGKKMNEVPLTKEIAEEYKSNLEQ